MQNKCVFFLSGSTLETRFRLYYFFVKQIFFIINVYDLVLPLKLRFYHMEMKSGNAFNLILPYHVRSKTDIDLILICMTL